METTIENTPGGALITRQTFSGEELVAQGGDFAPEAAAAAAAKEIEARCILAMKRPRNIDMFRSTLLRYCEHPAFAEQALYSKPTGGRVRNARGEWEDQIAVNFSIRFIEAALPIYGNLYIGTRVMRDDPDRMLLNVQAFDMQNNMTFEEAAIVPKLIERKEARDRVVHRQRMTSENRLVYLVEATMDEVRNLKGAQRSRLIRDLGQKILPFHILADARAAIDRTNANENARDPEAAKKKIIDRFAAVGVTAEMLGAYLERPLDGLSLKDLAELGVLYNGMKDGDITWTDVMRVKAEPAEGEATQGAEPKPSKLKEKIMSARQKPEAAAATKTEGETK
jgi:hypothetical protein